MPLIRHDIARMAQDDPPPVPWVVHGLAVRGALTVLAGKPGEGKSLLSEVLAAGVARGVAQAGMECAKGTALILDAENGEHEIHRRVRALGMPGEGVEVYEASGFDLRRDLSELAALLREHAPDLLVLDSFRSLWGGEENDSGEVAAVLDPLRNLVREHGAATLLVHQAGKMGNGYRGSSAIAASAELGFTLARPDDDADRTRRELTCWKCRPAPEPPKRWLSLVIEDRVLVGEALPTGVASDIATALLPLVATGPLKQAEIARQLGRTPGDGTVRRALEKARNAGEVVQLPDGSWALPK